MGFMAASVAMAVVAAGLSAYGTYSSIEAQADQAKAQRRAAEMQAEAERQAGEARRRAVLLNAERVKRSMLSRQAAAGVQTSEGSLLENEMEYASNAEYDAQLAAYPHNLRAQADDYQARLFGYQRGRLLSSQGLQTGLAAGSSLAASGSRLASNYRRPSPQPSPARIGAWDSDW